MKRVMSWEQFKENITNAVGTRWVQENSPLEDDYKFLQGFSEGDFAYTNDEGEKFYPEFIEQDGGGEGGAEGCYSVFKIGDKFYQVDYTYRSHEGFDFDYADVYEVTPRETTITIYE